MMDEKKVREAIYCMKASIGETTCEECVNYYKCDHTKMEEMTTDRNRSTGEAAAEKSGNKESGRRLYVHVVDMNYLRVLEMDSINTQHSWKDVQIRIADRD